MYIHKIFKLIYIFFFTYILLTGLSQPGGRGMGSMCPPPPVFGQINEPFLKSKRGAHYARMEIPLIIYAQHIATCPPDF